MIEIIRSSDAKWHDGSDKYVRSDGKPRPILSLTHGLDNSDVSKILKVFVESGRGDELVGLLQRVGLFEDVAAADACLAAVYSARPSAKTPEPESTDVNGNGDYYVLGTGVPRVPHRRLATAVSEAERIANMDPGKVVRVLQQVAWRRVELKRSMEGNP